MKDCLSSVWWIHCINSAAKTKQSRAWLVFCAGVNKAEWDQPGFSSCPVLEAQCWEWEKTESQAARWWRCSVAAWRLGPRRQRGKTTESWQGTMGRGLSQSSAEGLRRESLTTIIWTLFNRVHISKPIHRKRRKTLWTAPAGICWGHSCAALNCFYFMYWAWLHQSRACDMGMFQDRVKTICSLETSRVPGEGVKPRECWSVSCLCYDFCPVTQTHPWTSLSLAQLCQQGTDHCCRRSRRHGQPPKSQWRV